MAQTIHQSDKLPLEVREALERGLLKRLPLTFQPYYNQEVREWDALFPFEARHLAGMIGYLGSLSNQDFEALFRNVRELETRMDVRHWVAFSTNDQTMENSSLLTRSSYYQGWRREAHRVNEQIERGTSLAETGSTARTHNRLILLILPGRLPLNPETVWKHWKGEGKELILDLTNLGPKRSFMGALFGEDEKPGKRSFLGDLARASDWSADDIWLLDGSTGLVSLWNEMQGSGVESGATLLSFPRLKALREELMEHVDTIRKDLADADAVIARLRKLDVREQCPPEISAQPIVQQFVRNTLLSGNGALLYGSAFVEWAASEGFRRARPSVVVAYYGIRNKPKPFTSVAVFQDPEKASPLPEVEDLAGSAVDAQVMAHYTWLAATRYPEYERAACLCLAEGLTRACLVAPADFPLWEGPQPIRIDRLPSLLASWLA
jgi:hypothetical protein